MINSKLYFRTSVKTKRCEHPVYLRINQGKKVTEMSMNVFTRPDCWNHDRLRITSKDPLHTRKNTILKHYELKAAKINEQAMLHNRKISLSEFILLMKDSAWGSESLFDYANKIIQHKTGISQPGSIKVMKDQVNKLRSFRNEIKLHDVDLGFILAYEKFLKVERKNNDNTVIKSMKFLNQVTLHAFKNGLLEKNPFVNYTIGRIEGKREHLTETEVNKLVELYNGNTLKWNKQNVLRYFLFSCFTGLAYADIKGLQKKHITRIDNKGTSKEVIKFERQKTGSLVLVPLLPEAKTYIPENLYYDGQKVFRVFTDQPTNRYLKEIMLLAGISKRISFHCGRHTFATICKTKGINYDIIARYLGHQDKKTTEIYAKYETELLLKEMEKWERSGI